MLGEPMKVGVVFFLILSIINLTQLLLGNPFNGGKVTVPSSTYTIIMQSILVLILGYLSVKLKWEE